MSSPQTDSFWRGRKVLVTGATGIIGSWLVKALLARGAHVVVFLLDADHRSELIRSGDIAQTSVVNGAIEDYWAVERAINEHEVEAVFHLAAQAIVGTAYRSPLPTFETNIRGTYNLLEACRLHKDLVNRVIIASSDKAYGEQARLPYTEDMPLLGRQPYEVSKTCADLVSQAYHHAYGLPIAIARCGNVYGGGDLNWNRIVPGTIRSFLRQESPVIRSDGSFLRDYIYVKDVALAYIRLAECMDDDRVTGEAFNFGSETPMDVLGLVDIIQRLMGCQNLEAKIKNNAHGEIRSQYVSNAKARAILDWRPNFRLESGMEETIDWYRGFIAEELS